MFITKNSYERTQTEDKIIPLTKKLDMLYSLASNIVLSPVSRGELYKFFVIKKKIFDSPTINNYGVFIQEYIASLFNGANTNFFVKKGSDIVGTVSISFKYDEAKIYNLGLLKEHRGYGYAKDLVREALNFCYIKDSTLAALNVQSSNDIALNLYTSLGFNISKKGL